MNKETSLIKIAKKESGAVNGDKKSSKSISFSKVEEKVPLTSDLNNVMMKTYKSHKNISEFVQFLQPVDENSSLAKRENLKQTVYTSEEIQLVYALNTFAHENEKREFSEFIEFNITELADRMDNSKKRSGNDLKRLKTSLRDLKNKEKLVSLNIDGENIIYQYELIDSITYKGNDKTTYQVKLNKDWFKALYFNNNEPQRSFTFVTKDLVPRIKSASGSRKITDSVMQIQTMILNQAVRNEFERVLEPLLGVLYPKLVKNREWGRAKKRLEKELKTMRDAGQLEKYSFYEANGKEYIQITTNHYKNNKKRILEVHQEKKEREAKKLAASHEAKSRSNADEHAVQKVGFESGKSLEDTKWNKKPEKDAMKWEVKLHKAFTNYEEWFGKFDIKLDEPRKEALYERLRAIFKQNPDNPGFREMYVVAKNYVFAGKVEDLHYDFEKAINPKAKESKWQTLYDRNDQGYDVDYLASEPRRR